MNIAELNDLLNQAGQDFADNDPRKGMVKVLLILKDDFTNESAWRLLYQVMKSNQPFEVFQMAIAQKNFPDKVHLLLEKELTDMASHIPPEEFHSTRMPKENIPQPSVQEPNSINYGFCPECGKNRTDNSRFCPSCGYAFWSEGGNPREGIQQEELLYNQDNLPYSNRYQENQSWPVSSPQTAYSSMPNRSGESRFNIGSAFVYGLSCLIGSVLGLGVVSGNFAIGLITGIPAAILGFVVGGFFIKKKNANTYFYNSPVRSGAPYPYQAPQYYGIPQSTQTSGNIGLVVITWILFVGGFLCGFFNILIVGYVVQIVTLILAIILACSRRTRTHGWIILILWLIIQTTGFVIGFNSV